MSVGDSERICSDHQKLRNNLKPPVNVVFEKKSGFLHRPLAFYLLFLQLRLKFKTPSEIEIIFATIRFA
jgi:hypothetical protein